MRLPCRGTYTVVLDKPPTGCALVSVDVASDTTGVTVSPGTLTFRRTGATELWSAPQTVTVTAGQDDDGADAAATVTHSVNQACNAAGYVSGFAIPGVSVAVDDDETPGVTIDADPSTQAVDAGPLALAEGHATDATADWSVRLATPPTQTVTVTLTSADAGAVTIDDTDGDNTNGVQDTLTFTTSNWDTAQTVTARAADDADATNESVTLTAATSTATASEYESSEGVSASLTATVADDDALTAPGSVTVAAQVRALRIGWGAVTGANGYKVQWKSGQEGYDPAEREGTATGTAHTVDNLAAGTAYTVRVIPTRTGANDGPASAEATGTPLTVPTLVIDSPSVAEGTGATGGTLTFTVDLSHASQHQVTVGYADAGTGTATAGASGAAGADYVTLTAGTLTIAAGDTRRTVDVTVAGDTTDEPDETVRVTLSGPVNATLATATGTGTITDDDATPTVTLALTASTIGESGAANVTTVTASLNRPSSAAMTVTVAASPGAGTDFTLSSAYTLTLAAGATTSTGTVTITATDDDTDSPDKQVTVSGTVAAATVGGSAVANPASVTLTITDDDATPTVTLALDPDSIAEEGGVSTVTAALDRPSSAVMTVTVGAAPGTGAVAADFSLSTATTLTLAAGATTSTGTVTVTATGNAVDTGSKEVTVSGTVAAATVGGSAVANPSSRTLTITDDDTAGVVVSPATATAAATTPLRTTEAGIQGGQATFTVALASEPTGDVVIAVASSDTGEGTVSPSSLTFTASDWSTAQTVTLTGVDDAPTPQNPNPATGARPWTVSLTVNQASTADSTYDALAAVTVHAVNVDDEYGLAVGSVMGQATEAGATATFTVALNTQPSAAVTVTVASRDEGEGRVSTGGGAPAATATLAFTTSNWSTNQTVTVTGEDDTDHDGTVTWQVRLDPASGGSGGDSNYHGLANVDVDVTTTDDDTLTAALSLSAASIAESGSSNTSAVSAVLSRPSGSATTLTVTAVSGAFTVPSGAAGRIEIAAGDTTTTGTVTITAVDNDTDAPDRTETVTATAANDTGSGVASVTGATLTITDDDAPPDVTLALSDNSISENGGTSVVSATLSRASSAATTIEVTAVSGAFTVPSSAAGRRIVFAAGDTTSADTVTVTAVDNTTDEPNRMETVSATMANDQGTGSVTGVTLTLTDDDDAPTVTLSASPASVSENEGTSAISAALSNPSSAVTTVTVTAAMGAAYRVASAPADRRIVVAAGATTSTDTATVTAVNNDVDAADNAVTVTGTAANTQGVGTVTGASLTITDDDTAGLAVSPSTATSASGRLRTTEAGGQTEFTVALTSQPTGNVSVSVASSDTAQGTVSASSLTFTASNWATAQTVTLTGVDDDHPVNNPGGTTDGSQTWTVTLTSSSTVDAPYNGLAQVTVYAINADDELGLDVGAVMGQATEAGGTATFTVALLTQPTAAVTVAVSSRDASEGRVSPSSLTFSASSWNVNQTVTVTGLNDDVDDGDVAWAVRLDPASGGSGGDADYHALANVDVSVTTTDDDTAALVVSPTPSSTSRLRTTEAGGAATFTVRLATEPVGNVVLDVASTDTAEGTVDTDPVMNGAQSTLTFTASSWNSAQTVTLTGANDDVDDGDRDYAATLTVNQGSTADASYDALSAVTVYATNADDDEAGVSVSPATTATSRLRTSEDGSQATFTVVLDSEPTGDVVLDVASSDTAQGTVDTDPVMNGAQSALTFTAGNWNTAQTVTLTGVDDSPGLPDGSQDYTVTLTVNTASTADASYDALASSPVTVYARNLDDELGIDVGPVSGPATEAGGTATFTVALQTQPSAAVTVSVTSLDAGEGTVSPASLTFTTSDWGDDQTVTVTGVDDATDDGDVTWQVRLKTSSGGDADYHALEAGNVPVTTTDDDAAPAVTLVLTPPSISETGGVTRVTAVLSHLSSEPTTVTVAAAPEAPAVADDFTLSAATLLTVAAGATASTGEVTVTAVGNHVDAPDKEVSVTGTAQNGRAAADGETVAVAGATLTIEDDDEKGLAFEPAELFAVAAGGSTSYTVALTSQPSGAVTVAVSTGNESVTVSSGSLTFTATDWNEAQTVTVSAGADDGDGYAHAAAPLTHRATGGGYDGVAGTVSVAVAAEGVTKVEVEPDTSRRYFIEGRWVAVTIMAGVPEGIEADFAGVGSAPADAEPALAIASGVPAQTIAEAAGDGFNLGPEGSRTVVDIEVTDTPVTVSLPVKQAVVDAAGDTARLRLLRHDGSAWVAVEGAQYVAGTGTEPGRMVASLPGNSPFATGYVDTSPEFSGQVEVCVQNECVWEVDEPVEPPVTLPAVKEGTGDGEIRYTLTPGPETLPSGVSYEPASRRLSGTPTEEFTPPKDYTWTAEDADGETVALTFSIEVKPAVGPARARLKAINESILPEVSRASWDSAMAAVARRLESSAGGGGGGSGASGGGLATALAGFARANEQALEDDASWKELLSGQSFTVGLGGEGEGAGAGTGFGRSVTVWGAGDRRRLSRDVPSLAWSGELSAFHLGADVGLDSGFTGGLGISWFESEVGYVDRGGEDGPIEGEHRSRMASVQPYLGWSSEDGSRLWASVGYGSGEVEIEDKALVERFGRQASDSELLAAAAGGAVRVVSAGAARVDLKGEGQVTRYTVDENGDLIAGLSVETRRVRVSAEGSREYVLDGGGRLTPSAELGIRWDGGDGATGAGGEVGGGLSWSGPGRLVVEVGGRWLAGQPHINLLIYQHVRGVTIIQANSKKGSIWKTDMDQYRFHRK